MKNKAILILILLVCFSGFSQNKSKNNTTVKKIKKEVLPPPPPPPNAYINVKPHKINFTKYNLSKRLSFYPFNKASKIMVVSFSTKVSRKAQYEMINDSISKDSLFVQKEAIESFKIPMKNNSILFDKMDQKKILSISEAIKISDLLYNSCYRWSEWEDKVVGCYYPRNAIIFFDENDKPFEYLEICFECRAIEKSSQNIKLIENCSYIYEELEKYFNNLGIITNPENE